MVSSPCLCLDRAFLVSWCMNHPPSIDQLVRQFADRYNPELGSNYTGVIHLVLKGSEPYECTLVISEGGCAVTEGLEGHPDCEIKTKSEAFRRIVNNESSPQQEFIMGQISVSNLQVIMLIGKAFR